MFYPQKQCTLIDVCATYNVANGRRSAELVCSKLTLQVFTNFKQNPPRNAAVFVELLVLGYF